MQIPTEDQERWGAAVAILSLDVVLPFYGLLGIEITEASEWQQLLRATILSNRRKFEKNPGRIPDLREAILKAIRTQYGRESVRLFEDWVENVFLFVGQDFVALNKWYMLLALSRRNRQRWEALSFPQELTKEAQQRMEDVLNRDQLHRLADQIEEVPLSDWDLEMYALHGFDDDDNDPYNWVLETVKKRRFLEYMRWLVSSMDENQRQQLAASASVLRMKIETTRRFPPFEDPKRLI